MTIPEAAAGVTVYRGGAYPETYYGNVFTPDGQNNLIHRRVLTPDGVSFQSRRADENTEFVRSSDLWFRPVNLLNAPDGTLYALDMSREIAPRPHRFGEPAFHANGPAEVRWSRTARRDVSDGPTIVSRSARKSMSASGVEKLRPPKNRSMSHRSERSPQTRRATTNMRRT